MHIYENYEETQGLSKKEFGSYSRLEASYFTREMSELKSVAIADKEYRVLDVGFGNGAFMGWCRDNAIVCHGLEVNPAQVKKATSVGYTACTSFDDINGQSYSAIAGFDVPEHIESSELVAFLSSVKRFATHIL